MVAVYVSTFVLIVTMVFIGYKEPQSSSAVSNVVETNLSDKTNQTSVDDVVATNIAASVAQAANLPIANSVTNLAISAQTKSEFNQDDIETSTKPQLIQSDSDNRSITSHTVVVGDTVDTLAKKYGISKQTIKWENDLTTDALSVGSVLRILPIDGVIYSVKAGDTVDSIASRYKVDKTRIILYNDLDVSGLKPYTSIILPDATLPGEEQPGYVAPVMTTTTTTTISYYAGSGTGFGGKTWNIGYGARSCPSYGYGQWTCYAYARRVQLGLPVGTLWGDAGSWAQSARYAGLVVDGNPGVGAIIQDWGHVAIVESILPNGDLSISEMNAYVSGGGWNIVSGRIVSAGNVGQYLFIH